MHFISYPVPKKYPAVIRNTKIKLLLTYYEFFPLRLLARFEYRMNRRCGTTTKIAKLNGAMYFISIPLILNPQNIITRKSAVFTIAYYASGLCGFCLS